MLEAQRGLPPPAAEPLVVFLFSWELFRVTGNPFLVASASAESPNLYPLQLPLAGVAFVPSLTIEATVHEFVHLTDLC